MSSAQKLTEEILEQNKAKATKNVETQNNQPTQATPTPQSSATSTPVQSTQPAAPSLSKGSYVNVKSGVRWYADSYGGGNPGMARSGSIKYINLKGSHPYNIDGLGWIKKSDIVGYDTGGYTGNWADGSGKLAMLHKKELILNANDTENILNAVEIMRNITNSLNNTLLDKLATVTAHSGISAGTDTLEQNVHIEANFPNVTSQNEIEEAINNLVNVATQRINR